MARRPFSTVMQLEEPPVWEPLEAVAALARASTDLPSFHEGEFMYMCSVYSPSKKLRIHLYKHVDTRRYLNLDDERHAYEYCGPLWTTRASPPAVATDPVRPPDSLPRLGDHQSRS